MFSIAKNVIKILMKRKSFLMTAIIVPIIVTIIFSVLMGSENTSYKIAIVDNDKSILSENLVKKISSVEGITIVKEDSLDLQKLAFHEYEIMISIDKGFEEKLLNEEIPKVIIKSVGESDIKYILKGIIDGEVNLLDSLCRIGNNESNNLEEVIREYNNSPMEVIAVSENTKKRGNVAASIGIIAYCIFINGNIGSSFILEDERAGTKNRILLSKCSEGKYYGALIMVMFAIAAIPCFVYYIFAKVINMEFNMDNSVYVLIMLLLIALISVSISILLSTVIKRQSVLGVLSQLISLPAFMLSGALWDFELMSEGAQKIGSVLPPRWIFESISELNKGATFTDVLPNIGAVILFVIVVFLLSGFLNKMKIVFVKYN